MFVVEAQNQWEARAVAHFAFMAGAVDENQAAGLDDEPKQRGQQPHLNGLRTQW